MNKRAIGLAFLSLFWAIPALAQTCPVLHGDYMCGPRGGAKNLRLNVRTEGNAYTFSAGSQEAFNVLADGQVRRALFGGQDKEAEYRAVCEGGKLNMDFRMYTKINGQRKLMVAKDSYYNERGGLVRVRVYDNQRSEVKAAPSVISCSPIFSRRPQERRAPAPRAAPAPLPGQMEPDDVGYDAPRVIHGPRYQSPYTPYGEPEFQE